MNEEELSYRIRFLLGNYRNLIYYHSIDLSERSTYIHPVRGFRKKAITILSEIPREDEKYGKVISLLSKIVASCDPKIKSDDCSSWIEGPLFNLLKEYDIL